MQIVVVDGVIFERVGVVVNRFVDRRKVFLKYVGYYDGFGRIFFFIVVVNICVLKVCFIGDKVVLFYKWGYLFVKGIIYYVVFVGSDVVFKLNISEFWGCFVICVKCVVVDCIIVKCSNILDELRFFYDWVVFFIIDSEVVYVSVFVGFIVNKFVVVDYRRRVSIICQIILVGIVGFFNLIWIILFYISGFICDNEVIYYGV